MIKGINSWVFFKDEVNYSFIPYLTGFFKHIDTFLIKLVTDSTVRNHRSETDESNPNDDIYDHLNLRVHHSNHSIYHTGSMAVTGDTASGSNVPLQQAQSEESIQNTYHDCDFQRHEEEISESLVDEPHRETVNDKTTDQQAVIYSTLCKRITKRPLSFCSQEGQQKSCDMKL